MKIRRLIPLLLALTAPAAPLTASDAVVEATTSPGNEIIDAFVMGRSYAFRGLLDQLRLSKRVDVVLFSLDPDMSRDRRLTTRARRSISDSASISRLCELLLRRIEADEARRVKPGPDGSLVLLVPIAYHETTALRLDFAAPEVTFRIKVHPHGMWIGFHGQVFDWYATGPETFEMLKKEVQPGATANPDPGELKSDRSKVSESPQPGG